MSYNMTYDPHWDNSRKGPQKRPSGALMKYIIESRPKGEWCVREYNDQDELTKEVPAAVSVTDACRILKKSRRQLYRYMKDGWVKPVGKFLNEWLVDGASLEQIRLLSSAAKARLPRNFQWMYPEYRIENLRPAVHAISITGPILEMGGRKEIRWLLRTYPKDWLVWFLRDQGRRLLTKRSLNFWSLWFGIEMPPPTWREIGRILGGVG